MNRIALGTVQFGLNYGIANVRGQMSHADASDILSTGKAMGLDTLDTAVAYGESEQRLGAIGIDGWKVVTKLPGIPDDCGDVKRWVDTSVRESMARLGVTRLYGLLLHQPGQLLEPGGEKLHEAMQALKQSGLVQKTGISIYDPPELDALCSRFPIDMVQAPFNILDRRMQQSGWLDRLANEGVELHVRSVFLQGLLLMNPQERRRRFVEWNPLWRILEEWIGQMGITPLDACIGYALSFPQIQRVVVGIDSPDHLNEILRSSGREVGALPDRLSSSDPNLLNPGLWGER